MEELNKAKSVVEFWLISTKLKDVIRTGWKFWKVKKARLESVAEHVYGVQSLALAMWSQYNYDVDINKVILMLAIHELEETIIGDLTAWDTSKEEKTIKGHEAVALILKDFIKKDEIEQIIHEFDDRKTKEALFAHYCDKLECDLQAKLYDEEGYVDLTDQSDNPTHKDPVVQRYLKTGKRWSDMWMEFGREKYNYDPNFNEVSLYAEENGVVKKDA